ncbi:amino acid--tRNA ligase-related protein [Bacillus sp. SM2101]|uniref:amino acid--tRNA ligase-related protein n=1 Tax=Bacillus sp. SM2101 TaxID=2805366 RepID=UPI001BDF5536|nr:amino acid--tRNA ligase-related protein [Bacillus sp. SM2101]
MAITRTLIKDISDRDSEILIAGWIKKSRINEIVVWDFTGEILVEVDMKFLSVNVRDVVQINGDVYSSGDEFKVKANSIQILNTCEEESRRSYKKLVDFDFLKKLKLINEIECGVRDFLTKESFIEIRNPLLWESVQEYGFEEWKVLNNLSNQVEYTLLQSPNILNLLNVISGIERVFQFHPCFRLPEENNENKIDDLVEFTQLAINMAFVSNEQGKQFIERFFFYLIKKYFNKEITIPFDSISYDDAMFLYSSDKPDLRYKEFLRPTFSYSTREELKQYNTLIIPYELPKTIENKIIAKMKKEFSDYAVVKHKQEQLDILSGIDININEFQRLLSKLSVKSTGYTLLVDSKIRKEIVFSFFSSITRSLSRNKQIDTYNFCWIENYPFILDENETDPSQMNIGQNIFTKKIPSTNDNNIVSSKGIDLILNGVEIASGSEKEYVVNDFLESLSLLNRSNKTQQYNYYINALKSGSPPVFTIGIGWERVLWILLGVNKIQDVLLHTRN